MTDTQVMKREDRLPDTKLEAAVQKIQAPETDTIYVPEVDIREDHERVRLLANMPGVDQKTVTVSVENGVLTLEGQAHVVMPSGYKLVGQEYGVGRFRRDFTLSDAVAVEDVKARVQQGVLEVTLPKREEVKTRKIKIES